MAAMEMRFKAAELKELLVEALERRGLKVSKGSICLFEESTNGHEIEATVKATFVGLPSFVGEPKKTGEA